MAIKTPRTKPKADTCLAIVISQTTAVTVGAQSEVALVGLQITAALTGTLAIAGFSDAAGVAQTITLPAATPAGFKDFRGAVNDAGSLILTASNAADDNLVTVLFNRF